MNIRDYLNSVPAHNLAGDSSSFVVDFSGDTPDSRTATIYFGFPKFMVGSTLVYKKHHPQRGRFWSHLGTVATLPVIFEIS